MPEFPTVPVSWVKDFKAAVPWKLKLQKGDENVEPGRKSRYGKTARVLPDEGRHTVLVPCGDGRPPVKVNISMSPEKVGQHTIAWSEEVALPYRVDSKHAVLAPGRCNLYKYPKVFFDHVRKGKIMVPPPEALFVLERIVLSLLLEEADDGVADYAHRADGVGARPQHGLCLSNTPASLDLLLQAFRARPTLIPIAHVGQPFEGENTLHILAVNQCEDALCEVIELAACHLAPKECEETFHANATGVFFYDSPMCFYGSKVFSYAVAFSLDLALLTMLRCSKEQPSMKGIFDLNDLTRACPLTGFLPLHVAVANSLTTMFNFLIDLPGLSIEYDDMRADIHTLSTYGALQRWAALSPLQLATMLGDQRLVQYIIRTQSYCNWTWGPVSEWCIDFTASIRSARRATTSWRSAPSSARCVRRAKCFSTTLGTASSTNSSCRSLNALGAWSSY